MKEKPEHMAKDNGLLTAFRNVKEDVPRRNCSHPSEPVRTRAESSCILLGLLSAAGLAFAESQLLHPATYVTG